jgi:small subunit ribosomal protein S11
MRMAGNKGIMHIYASRNNTQLLLTDITGSEAIAKSSGGTVVKAQHKEGSPYAAMKAAESIAQKARDRGITHINIKVRGQGGIKPKTAGQGAEGAIMSLTRNGMIIENIENVTPVPHDGCRKKKRHRSKKS